MIRWTKDGKVVRNAPWASWDELADALDVAVAALRDYESLLEQGFLVRNTSGDSDPQWALKMMKPMMQLTRAAKALRQIGADHANG